MIARQSVERPQRWDVPFDPDLTPEKVDRILAMKPFCDIDQDKFPKRIPLRGIIENEAKMISYRRGDLVVRRGDYGNSAFFIMSGAARVVLEDDKNKLPEELLGRLVAKPKGLWDSIAQLWRNSKVPEYRERVQGRDAAGGDSSTKNSGSPNSAIFLQDIPGILERYKTVAIPAGEFFGEIAALGRTARTATIIADTDDTVMVEIKWQGLRELRKYTPSIKEHIDRLYRERSLTVQLRNTPMFAHLNDEQIQAVADQTQFKSVGDFDWQTKFKKGTETSSENRLDREPLIYEEGDYPDSLVLLRAGFARVSQRNGNGHKTISYLGKGQVFGFNEIAHNWRSEKHVAYRHSLRSLGYVDILVIPASVITEYVLPKMSKDELPPLFTFEEEGEVRSEKASAKSRDSKSRDNMSKTDVMEFLVENRFINGTATMLVNLDRCTRCDDCVRACASAHDNNPRFSRDGKVFGSLLVAHACMHCQDPVCMIGCPTGAIARQTGAGQVTINDITCIGCATCANSCPYENIKMVEVRDKNGSFITDAATHRPIVKATKCDLCIEQIGGPSCQNACPHDALVRMEMQQPENVTEWLQR